MGARRKKPILHTFEICDKVEEIDGKKSIIGIFKFIRAKGLPAVHPLLTIVLGFSGGIGHYEGKVQILNVSGLEIYNTLITLDFTDQDIDLELYHDIRIQNFLIMEVGVYTVNIYLEDEKIADKRFGVTILKPPEYSEAEIKAILEDPNLIKKVKAIVRCLKCQTDYVFQLNIDPSQPYDEDALPWPRDNSFSCPNDDFILDLTGLKITMQSKLGTLGPPEQTNGEVS